MIHSRVSVDSGFLFSIIFPRGFILNSITKAFSYLIAAHVQAVGIIFASWWIAKELDSSYPIGFPWLSITIPFGIIVVVHTFYLILRSLFWQKKAAESSEDTDTQRGGPN